MRSGAQARKSTRRHRGPRATWYDLRLDLRPLSNLLRVRATVRLTRFSTRTPRMRLWLGMLAAGVVGQVRAAPSGPGGWRPVKIKRELQWLDLTLPRLLRKTRQLELRLSYQIRFRSHLNYLFSRLFCRLEPGDSHFLYEWYPTTKPFADMITGQLLPVDRVRYRMVIEVPGDETAVTSGTLERVTRTRDGRRRFHWVSRAPSGAALFFVSGRFLRHRFDTAGLRVEMFVRKGLARKQLAAVAGIVARSAALYGRWFGPSGGRTWRIVEYGAAGARGYPRTILVNRYQGYLTRPLKETVVLYMSLAQVLAHEAAHTWWGNLLTGAGPGGTWVNEGLANFSSLRALGAIYGRKEELRAIRRHRREYMESTRPGRIFVQGGLSQIADPGVYTRGALVFYELARVIGMPKLIDGIARFARTHRGGYPGWRELKAAIEGSAGRKLDRFFEQWIRGDKLPDTRGGTVRRRTLPGPGGKRVHVTEMTLDNRGGADAMVPVAAILGKGRRKMITVAVRNGGRRMVRFRSDSRVGRIVLDPDRISLNGFRWRRALVVVKRLRKARRFKEALALLTRVLRSRPSCALAWYQAGMIREARGQPLTAIANFRKVLEVADPDQPGWLAQWARYRMADNLIGVGRLKAARKALRRVLRGTIDSFGVKRRAAERLSNIKKKRSPGTGGAGVDRSGAGTRPAKRKQTR